MGETLAVPFWLALPAAFLAAWAAYDKLVMPALRWMIARPANQLIDELSTRLRIGIRPFQRTRRQALIHRLVTDPKVLQAAERFSKEKGVALPRVLKQIERYAREIVPAFNAYLYFRIGYWIGRRVAQSLYRVLERYIAMATEAGVPQAVFPEGGLSRDGRMREPRVGVLDYMMRGFRIDGDRDLVFVPLGINYDRVLEDRTLVSSEKSGRLRMLGGTLRFLLHNVSLLMKSEWHRFGYACVNFGSPVSMREYSRRHRLDFQKLAGEERRQAMARLGRELMDAVGRVVPVVPVALIAHLFLEHRSLTELDLKAETRRLLVRLEHAQVYIPRHDLDYALTVGLRMLRLRHLVDECDGILTLRLDELPLLRYYANSIAHLL